MFFEDVELAPTDAVFGLNKIYNKDSRENKIYLVVGIYMDEDLNKNVMQTVQKAQEIILEEQNVGNYLPVAGDPAFIKNYGKLLFSENHFEKFEKRICGFQTVGGTSALRVGADFLRQTVSDTFFLPDPSWPNHVPIFQRAGFQIDKYSYYDSQEKKIDFDRCVEALSKMTEKSLVLFHVCCHNPTGCDFTKEQWKKIAEIVKEKNHLPFFDFAYQGFAEGIEEDRFAIELFVEEEIDFLLAATCSKNFSLYRQRVGGLYVFCSNSSIRDNVQSQIGTIIRANYSNPPSFGANVVSAILEDPSLKKEWLAELSSMRKRMETMRKQFADALCNKAKHRDFSSLYNHKGMFSYCGLEKEEVETLISEYGIYMLHTGRVNVCGLNDKNIDYVIDSILKVADK